MKNTGLWVFIIVIILVVLGIFVFSPEGEEALDDVNLPDVGLDQDTPFTITSDNEGIDITILSPNLREPVDQCTFDVTGSVTGRWFNEAISSLEIYGQQAEQPLSQEMVEAQGEWMTEEQVPFTVSVDCQEADCPEDTTLRFVRANPSGLPENADFAEIDIELPETCAV